MVDRPLPEAIRGSWYLLGEEGPPARALQDNGKLIALRLDGSFSRYGVDGDQRELEEEGDYTFDGDFLILRGRSTDTFRVHIEAQWYWFLEGKKKSRRLYRGLLEEGDFFEIPDDERRQIEMLPVRVRAETRFDDEHDAIFDLIYRNDDNDARRVGCCSVDTDASGERLWVGITPVATNLAPKAWEQIIRKSFLKAHSDSFEHVTVEVLDD